MAQSTTLVPVKVVAKLCGISRKEIDRRVHAGTFPLPEKLRSEEKAIRKGFAVNDLQAWLENPRAFKR
jgi:predicted DNA-binding transcriptional regulator AlpA